jgi:electron transfer flavoprotein alpha subunit
VDVGWIPYLHQIGQTGKTVRPKIYIACGISGAIQHRVGMDKADTIIAINKDASAPIFSFAHHGIVGDVYQIVPEMIRQLKAAKGNAKQPAASGEESCRV